LDACELAGLPGDVPGERRHERCGLAVGGAEQEHRSAAGQQLIDVEVPAWGGRSDGTVDGQPGQRRHDRGRDGRAGLVVRGQELPEVRDVGGRWRAPQVGQHR
jgi:hypothetical protein